MRHKSTLQSLAGLDFQSIHECSVAKDGFADVNRLFGIFRSNNDNENVFVQSCQNKLFENDPEANIARRFGKLCPAKVTQQFR